jgi:hypothetical protein
MCQAAGRLFGHYNSLASTKAFLTELSSDIGIPISALMQVIKGGDAAHQGTWVHPQVAIHLGQWLSPRFAVLVSVLCIASGNSHSQSWTTLLFIPHIFLAIASAAATQPTHET